MQHLELPQTHDQVAAVPTAADVAALTASSQLACLIIDGGLVGHEMYCHLFETRRHRRRQPQKSSCQLPLLQVLRATMGLLAEGSDVEAMVECCPNMRRLDVGRGKG
jgi:hypothetical protein